MLTCYTRRGRGCIHALGASEELVDEREAELRVARLRLDASFPQETRYIGRREVPAGAGAGREHSVDALMRNLVLIWIVEVINSREGSVMFNAIVHVDVGEVESVGAEVAHKRARDEIPQEEGERR